MPKCCVCKHDWCGMSGVMCTNCWEWITEKMTINDIAMVVAGIHHREPDNKHAQEICYYLVGDNYSHGTSKLAKGNYHITVQKISGELKEGGARSLLELVDNSEPNHELADAIEEGGIFPSVSEQINDRNFRDLRSFCGECGCVDCKEHNTYKTSYSEV